MDDTQFLRDCPFCGGHAYITFGIDKDTFVVQIQCERCGIRKTHCSHIDSPSLTNPACDFKRTEREAIDYWNGRMKVDAH